MTTRGRDILRTFALIAPVFAGLWLAGALPFSTAMFAVFAAACLAVILTLVTGEDAPAAAAAQESGAAAAGAADTAWDMIDRIPDPVLLIAPGGRIARANRAARDFLDLPQGTINIVAVLRQPEALDAVNAALDQGVPGVVEYRTAAPYEAFVKAFVAPLPGGAGALVTLHDETDLRRTERMRADFLANASHELRTPLASLSGFIETLRGHAKDDPAARERFLGVMHDQAERMRRLIDDLLSLSRIEMNEHLAPAGRVDLGQLAADVATALRPLAAARGASIDVVAAPPVWVCGDRDQLFAAAQNLMDNALKYSPKGGAVRVEILNGARAADAILPQRRDGAARFSIVSSETARPMAALRVIDQGPGIEAAHLPRLSQRFYRVEGGKTEERKGTGLGLAIVKHIMARHRGALIVDSRPGEGTMFTLAAPLADPAEDVPVEDDPHAGRRDMTSGVS